MYHSCGPTFCPLTLRCSGDKAAVRSEQTHHHGCGWGGEYEWVDVVLSSCLSNNSLLCKRLLVFLFSSPLLSACMSSLYCVISVNTFYSLNISPHSTHANLTTADVAFYTMPCQWLYCHLVVPPWAWWELWFVLSRTKTHTYIHAADVKLYGKDLIITSERPQVKLEIPSTSLSFLRIFSLNSSLLNFN